MNTEPISFLRLNFVRAAGDTLATNQIVLDQNGPSFSLTLRYLQTAGTWILDVSNSNGGAIVRGAWVRDRVDCLLGISTLGRPKGSLMAYDPKGRGDPGPDAFYKDGVLFLYVPLGLNPSDFSVYRTNVV